MAESASSSIERPKWDEYFMHMAWVASRRSKEGKRSRKVGAVIVSHDNLVISTGYNGFARRVLDLASRMDESQKERLRWTFHAEANAIINAARLGVSTRRTTIYVTKFPCLFCVNAIIQAGIQRVYTEAAKTYDDPISGDDGTRAVRALAEAGIELHAPNLPLHEHMRQRRQKPSKGHRLHLDSLLVSMVASPNYQICDGCVGEYVSVEAKHIGSVARRLRKKGVLRRLKGACSDCGLERMVTATPD